MTLEVIYALIDDVIYAWVNDESFMLELVTPHAIWRYSWEFSSSLYTILRATLLFFNFFTIYQKISLDSTQHLTEENFYCYKLKTKRFKMTK